MASLIGWLAYDGARTSTGAAVATGTAWFFQPGTTATQVTVFSDEDGLAAITQPVTLDAGGRATVFTMTPCRVEVQDADGVTVLATDRTNTVTAAEVEIENLGATGTDLTTGAQVAGGRTDLDAFITSLYASFGAPDGQVLVNGVPTNVGDAVAGTTAVWFNVTASPYNADSTGVLDSTSGIQAAINACEENGGGTVYFPAGTYKLDSSVASGLAITSSQVRLLGDGPSASTIVAYQTGGYALAVTGASLTVQDLGIATSGSGRTVSIAAADTHFLHCGITIANASGGIAFSTGAARPLFSQCGILNSSTGASFAIASGTPSTLVTGGALTFTSNSAGAQITSATSCDFRMIGVVISNTGSATPQLLSSSLNIGMLIGCVLSGTMTIGSPSLYVDAGSVFGSQQTPPASALYQSQRREHLYTRTSTSANAYVADATGYKFHEVVCSNAAMTFSANGTPAVTTGTNELVIRYKNTNAGAVTPAFSANFYGSSVSVASGSGAGWLFFYEHTLGRWVQVGAPVAYAS